MFAKLLKHEFKATRKILGILSLAALGVGLLGSLALRFLVSFSQQTEAIASNQSALSLIGITFCILFLMGCVLAIIAYAVASILLLLGRFYTNKFTDEGYLTFTLPVSCHQILLSSLANMAIWSLIIGLVIYIDIALILFLGCSARDDFLEFQKNFWALFHEVTSAMSVQEVGFIALAVLNGVASWLSGLIIPTFAITVGALIAKKHKLLTAFGIYWGINMAFSAVSTVISAIVMIGFAQVESLSVFVATGLPILLNLAVAIGGYFLMEYLLRRKLNLP